MSRQPTANVTPISAPPVGKLERTRQRLVRAIREEVNATGNFSAETVAARAGISTATFYNHFARKDDELALAAGHFVSQRHADCKINLFLLATGDLVRAGCVSSSCAAGFSPGSRAVIECVCKQHVVVEIVTC